MSPAIALFLGLALSLTGIKYRSMQEQSTMQEQSSLQGQAGTQKNRGIHQYTSRILQASIVLMGFGMSLEAVVTASKTGFVVTLLTVTAVMVLGILLGKLFRVEKNTALLIAAGTAICGGSAIAAVAPILRSKSYQNSFALIVVFVLNAVALFLFPFIGHKLGLSQEVFGNWAAIAIHDTSSVVGAGAIYGEEALQVATTVKLIRALWIIPLSLIIAFLNKPEDDVLAEGRSANDRSADDRSADIRSVNDGSANTASNPKSSKSKSIKFPWFILFFVVAILFANLFPGLKGTYEHFSWLGRRGMVVALFLIGSNITFSDINKSGARSFALGICLWVLIAAGSLWGLMR